MKRDDTDWVSPKDLIAAKQVRDLASGRRHTPISRHTLAAWRARETNPFPAPISVLEGAGPGGSDVEIWSRAAVKDWLKRR